MRDGRFVTGASDCLIKIYNNKTFEPEITINEHSDWVEYVIQLNSGILASSSWDKTIKLFNIINTQYNVIQTLNYHKYILFIKL